MFFAYRLYFFVFLFYFSSNQIHFWWKCWIFHWCAINFFIYRFLYFFFLFILTTMWFWWTPATYAIFVVIIELKSLQHILWELNFFGFFFVRWKMIEVNKITLLSFFLNWNNFKLRDKSKKEKNKEQEKKIKE